MQQWIPKGHTLEPKIWGEIGLRQGLYVGAGLFAGAMLFFILANFGLWVRVGGLALPPCLGLIVGFLRIKGLAPEAYVVHRVRFQLRRAGTLGVWDTGAPLGSPGDVLLGIIRSPKPQRAARPVPSQPSPAHAEPTRTVPKRKAVATTAYLTDAGPFGPLFTLAALAVASAILSYVVRGTLP
ncbi:MAG: PrgI family protein [Chloroflexi bacterium]|nr:PrgI family protein [Chloroflexota bacterium]